MRKKHTDRESIARWAVDRYSAEIFRYFRDVMLGMFKTFVKNDAPVLSVSFGSTPMRLFSPYRGEGTMEISARRLGVFGFDDTSARLCP